MLKRVYSNDHEFKFSECSIITEAGIAYTLYSLRVTISKLVYYSDLPSIPPCLQLIFPYSLNTTHHPPPHTHPLHALICRADMIIKHLCPNLTHTLCLPR